MKLKRLISLFLVLALCLPIAACRQDEQPVMESAEIESETEAETETEIAEPETEPPETEVETETETETETEPPLPESDELLTDPDSEITAYSDDEDDETEKQETEPPETEPETEPEPEEPPRIYNYLNGKTVTEEEQKHRPVAIMLNNLKQQLPQYGLDYGQIFYECAAEGGITRLMMLVDNYEDIGQVGSIRSSRDYFVDFLANHDALYVHAGGSAQAYSKISWRGIQNLDGVNMYLPSTFWRDQWRMYNIGYEHSMMTNGEGIVSGIQYKGYRTELDPAQEPLFQFYDEDTDHKISGSVATHIHMQSTSLQTVDFVYDKETGEYLRWQYNGIKHVDGTTGNQISVKNLIILFTDISLIPGDTAGRLSVGTVGSGQGYYITNGKRKVINWSREGKTTCLHLEYRNGDELILNSGKTFICVVDNSVAKKIEFDYQW